MRADRLGGLCQLRRGHDESRVTANKISQLPRIHILPVTTESLHVPQRGPKIHANADILKVPIAERPGHDEVRVE